MTFSSLPTLEGGEKRTSVFGSTAEMLLKSPLACSKTWAADLGVSDRQIRSWAAGEKIPATRSEQVVWQAKKYLKEFRDMEDAIDQLLLEQYGSTKTI